LIERVLCKLDDLFFCSQLLGITIVVDCSRRNHHDSLISACREQYSTRRCMAISEKPLLDGDGDLVRDHRWVVRTMEPVSKHKLERVGASWQFEVVLSLSSSKMEVMLIRW
jgi:hypothetical protein